MIEMIGRVWEYSQKNPDGFTLDLKSLKPIKRGICAAYEETQDSHGIESLHRVINHAQQHEGIIGGWLDSQSGLYYFDSVRVFDESDLEGAIEFALENQQLAIFVLSTSQTIDLR